MLVLGNEKGFLSTSQFSRPLRLGGFMWAFKQGYCGGDPRGPELESSPITLNRLMVSGSSWKLGDQGLQGA